MANLERSRLTTKIQKLSVLITSTSFDCYVIDGLDVSTHICVTELEILGSNMGKPFLL